MPIEIRELIIQAQLNDPLQPQPDNGSITLSIADLDNLKEQIIRECMDRMEQMLENKKIR